MILLSSQKNACSKLVKRLKLLCCYQSERYLELCQTCIMEFFYRTYLLSLSRSLLSQKSFIAVI